MGYGGAGPSFAIELDMVQDMSVGDPAANHIGVDMGGDMRSVMQFLELDFASIAPQYVWIDYVADRWVGGTTIAHDQLTPRHVSPKMLSKL